MNIQFRRSAIRLSVVSLVLAAFAASDVNASVQYKIDHAAFAPLSAPVAKGAKVKIGNIPVDGEMESLDLEPFQVFAADAKIQVMGENDEVLQTLPPPAVRFYRGTISGNADSLAFLSVSSSRIEGVIFKGDRRFGIGSRIRPHRQSIHDGPGMDAFIQEAEVVDDYPTDGAGFTCDLEGAPVTGGPKLSSVVRELKPAAEGALSSNSARWVINMVVETDYELYVNSGSSADNVNTFIANLMGAMSTIYTRELNAEVQLTYLGIHTALADPFSVVPGTAGTWNGSAVSYSSLHALLEFGDRWHNAPPSTAARSTTALISGKPQTAGVAWVDVLCQGDFFFSSGQAEPYRLHYGGRYSYNGGINPPDNLSVPNPDANPAYTVPSSNYWPLLQVAHETGHNVFSGHTHCRALTPADAVTYGRSFVDTCYSGQAGCYGGAQTIPAEKGTIMSYCHLTGGSNSRFIFGKTGEASYVITNDMKAAIQAATPNLSTVTAPASLASGASGVASVTNVGGVTYLWTVTNGVINSGQGTNSINFTATSDPTTVQVKATNTAGCSITDSKSVTVGVSVVPPTNVVATATSTSNVNVTWTAAAGATSYNVYRSSGGGAYTLIGSSPGTSYNDGGRSANTAYLYRVRSVNGGESTDSNFDLATTVIFTDDPLVGGTTAVKAVHVTELRTAINAVRTLAALGAGTFTDATLIADVTAVKAVHMTDLRTAINAARSTLTLSALSYVDSITSAVTGIKASHVTELRNGVK